MGTDDEYGWPDINLHAAGMALLGLTRPHLAALLCHAQHLTQLVARAPKTTNPFKNRKGKAIAGSDNLCIHVGDAADSDWRPDGKPVARRVWTEVTYIRDDGAAFSVILPTNALAGKSFEAALEAFQTGDLRFDVFVNNHPAAQRVLRAMVEKMLVWVTGGLTPPPPVGTVPDGQHRLYSIMSGARNG
jgi:hypothetical protein